ncbi:hypothetical protein NAEGRDRAFT_59212 [Naegleria gruberi]|uniref:Uncharacterized protein n=1 Tax=Naegleria gruberi TaxID=5762 RepID=D2VTX6_NAEGR|nr:uncharacterized protein NAEGRDRAFT_59212 [Naegleria gruberi]EFC39735.1 hypothetical protein NAEGRDRAFT_59212 [Naegleria gruberi]|eukprot:XP_002672479.1 hypothetical protein NAEGRDRAFT_59212 [Naegleria gruberi strain NEG-M]
MTLTMLSKNSPNMMMMLMNESSSSSSSTTVQSTSTSTPTSNSNTTTTNCNNTSSCTFTTASNSLNNNLTREQLERFVSGRQFIQDNLRERNILRDYETNRLGYQVSHTLSSTIEKILWKKRQSSLSQKLENRPNIEQLEQRGIIPFLHHYYDQTGMDAPTENSEKPSSNNSSKENSPVSSPRLDHHQDSSLHLSSSHSPSSIPYLYDHEQTLCGIGIGREEKERKKRHIESFLVRRPSKKDLVDLFTRKGNASPTGLLGNHDQENPTLIYDVTASNNNLSTFDPMSILLEPHVLQIHNQLESIYNQRGDISSNSSSSDNLNEQEDESNKIESDETNITIPDETQQN